MIRRKQNVGAGIGVMILNGNKVLLGKRHSDPKKASSLLHGEGTWTMPGGKLHFGESLTEAVVREVFEETGMKVKKVKIISLSNDKVKDAHFITVGFLCTDFEGEPKIMEPKEIVKWQWFDLGKLPGPIYSSSGKIIKNYLEGILYSDK